MITLILKLLLILTISWQRDAHLLHFLLELHLFNLFEFVAHDFVVDLFTVSEWQLEGARWRLRLTAIVLALSDPFLFQSVLNNRHSLLHEFFGYMVASKIEWLILQALMLSARENFDLCYQFLSYGHILGVEVEGVRKRRILRLSRIFLLIIFGLIFLFLLQFLFLFLRILNQFLLLCLESIDGVKQVDEGHAGCKQDLATD